MRVTNKMIATNTLYNLNRNLSRMEKRNNQISTGKRINRPSDDPISTAKALRLRADVSEIEQYTRNTEDALSWLNITESAVDNLEEIIHKARELAVRGATESFSEDDREVIADEIRQLRAQILNVGNSTYLGRHIFSGFQTDRPLFEQDGTYNIDTSAPETKILRYQIGVGEEMDIGVFGLNIFGGAGGAPGAASKIIEDFDDLIDALDDDETGDISAFIGEIDGHLDNVLSIRSEIGAKTNRLELIRNRLEENDIDFTDLLNKNENVDMAETFMNLKMEESIYRASLSAGAQILQPTLIDFIR